MGVLGWSPIFMAHFTALFDGVGVLAQGSFVNTLSARIGNRRSFELGALVSVASYFLQGLGMLLWSGRSTLLAIHYTIAVLLLQTIPLSMRYSSRAMIVKQGMVVCGEGVGLGELNAACTSPLFPSSPRARMSLAF